MQVAGRGGGWAKDFRKIASAASRIWEAGRQGSGKVVFSCADGYRLSVMVAAAVLSANTGVEAQWRGADATIGRNGGQQVRSGLSLVVSECHEGAKQKTR